MKFSLFLFFLHKMFFFDVCSCLSSILLTKTLSKNEKYYNIRKIVKHHSTRVSKVMGFGIRWRRYSAQLKKSHVDSIITRVFHANACSYHSTQTEKHRYSHEFNLQKKNLCRVCKIVERSVKPSFFQKY